MAPAEALQHVIDMSTDGTEAVSDLRILDFAIVPICKFPDDLLKQRRLLLDRKLQAATGSIGLLSPEDEAALAEVRAELDDCEAAHQIAWHRAFLGEMGFAVVPIEPDASAIERIAIITCSGQWGELTDDQRKSELIVARAAYDAAVKETCDGRQ